MAVQDTRQTRVQFQSPALASDPSSMPSSSPHQLFDLEQVTSSLCVSSKRGHGTEYPARKVTVRMKQYSVFLTCRTYLISAVTVVMIVVMMVMTIMAVTIR